MSKFIATPTQESFMVSDKYVRVLAGPIGGGKSVACAHELMRWACAQEPNHRGERKTRFLIVRNTADQLRNTTRKTVFDWFPPGESGLFWKETDKTLYIEATLGDGSQLKSEWMFIALDTPDDVRKALSLEATGLWGNEARELHPDVVGADRLPEFTGTLQGCVERNVQGVIHHLQSILLNPAKLGLEKRRDITKVVQDMPIFIDQYPGWQVTVQDMIVVMQYLTVHRYGLGASRLHQRKAGACPQLAGAAKVQSQS